SITDVGLSDMYQFARVVRCLRHVCSDSSRVARHGSVFARLDREDPCTLGFPPGFRESDSGRKRGAHPRVLTFVSYQPRTDREEGAGMRTGSDGTRATTGETAALLLD